MTKKRKEEIQPPWSNDPALRSKIPRDASTVLLLRDDAHGPPEVFMVRRHSGAAFMGGLWVFPGGKVDSSDSDQAMMAGTGSSILEQCLARLEEATGSEATSESAFALQVAAIRELFEEAGVLLGHTASERALDEEALRQWQERVQQQGGAFVTMVQELNLVLDLDRLVYVSRWITPSAEPMRFDTRFFAARAPANQVPLIDRAETTDGGWGHATTFLERHDKGELTLAPPTLRHLEELAAYQTVDDYLLAMAKRPVAPILPKMVMDGGSMTVVLPWDPHYDSFQGESLDLGKSPHPLAGIGGPSRFVLREGRFFSAFPYQLPQRPNRNL